MKPAAPNLAGEDAPILVELRVRLEATDDPVERAALRIRQALYLARTHRLPDAQALVPELREHWEQRGSAPQALRVFVWLWLLEGVLDFYTTSRTKGRTRLLQAQAAAGKAGWRAERELASAWLAHLAYVENDYPAMLAGLQDSGLGTAALEESMARSSQTMACALQWFGHSQLAGEWFARARAVALRTGDRAGIMAATANRAMLRLSDNWLSFAFGEALPHDAAGLRQELQAILGYEQLSGSASLQEQNEIARVHLAVLRGDDQQAMAQLSQMVSAQQRHSVAALTMAAVEQAWLQARQAKPLAAQSALQAAQQAMSKAASAGLDEDDAAACVALMAQLAQRAGDAVTAADLRRQAEAARARSMQVRAVHQADLLAVESEARAHWPTG